MLVECFFEYISSLPPPPQRHTIQAATSETAKLSYDYAVANYKGKYNKHPFLWVFNPNNTADLIVKHMPSGNFPGYDINRLIEFLSKDGVQKTMLDIGAHIGAVTLDFAANGWKCYSIEASSINFDLLEKSCKINGFDVDIINNAVYDKKGVIYFHQSGVAGFVCNQERDTTNDKSLGYERLEAIALNDWKETKMQDMQRLDFIKMDVEGSEPAIMRGAGDFLRHFNYPPIYAEINTLCLARQGETACSQFKTFSDYGYVPYKFVDGFLQEYDPNMYQIEHWTDYLFVKNEIPEFKLYILKKKYAVDERKIYDTILSDLNSQNVLCREQVCLRIKDYPEYCNLPEIAKKLSEIKNNDTSADVQTALWWYK